ncbi:MAG TPA: hypothetical protein VHQ97_03610 [Solirubrobacterales bacterium]|jgi:hypothetical protein|nr:hypothetical protein [Solirubrobacterales bacterium]
MDSLDAQCLLIDTVAGEIPPPSLWRHSRSGELSCAYASGEQTFTWSAGDVAEMASRWRTESDREVPEHAGPYLDAHRRFEEMLAQGGLELPDLVVHDFDRRELRAVWEDRKAVVVIDEIDGPAAVDGAPTAGRPLDD